MDSREVIARHEESGRRFTAGGVDSFVLDAGAEGPVVCLHGVPTSAFLYRKLVVELAARGLRGMAFDLPGLGRADRATDFDYTWTGLGRFTSPLLTHLTSTSSTWSSTTSADPSGSSSPRRSRSGWRHSPS